MKPLKFDLENCIDLMSDAERRDLGDRARKDADMGSMFYGCNMPTAYWSGVVEEHRWMYYKDCFVRRMKRIERKGG